MRKMFSILLLVGVLWQDMVQTANVTTKGAP